MFLLMVRASQMIADVLTVDWSEDSETSAQLLRTKSDAGVLRRGQRRSPSDQRKIRRHRFSINGHFYNHKVLPGRTYSGSLCAAVDGGK